MLGRRIEELADGELFGFVLKKDSPTCGLERVKVYGTAGVPSEVGTRVVCRGIDYTASPAPC